MIVHHATYRASLCQELIRSLGLGHGVVAPSEPSYNSMTQRANGLSNHIRFNDFRWYRDPSTEPEWIGEVYGSRAQLRASAGRRRDFMLQTAQDLGGPLVSPTGTVNDGQSAAEYARELVTLRDSRFPDREVLASFAVERHGLTDNSTLASVNSLPGAVDGIALMVQDVAAYPSVWTEDDWYGWLRLIRALVQAGHRVILPYSDLRGIVGVGVGAEDFGSGPQQDMRQLRPARTRQRQGGARPAISYLSVPLLAVVHGSQVSVDASAPVVESHRHSSEALGTLDLLHLQTSEFDREWMASGLPQGQVTDSRIMQHLMSLAAVERAMRLKPNPADAVEDLLVNAEAVAEDVPSDLFKVAGTKTEIVGRLRAFRRVRGEHQF